MGLFKKIKKGFKNVVGGVKKVFKSATKFVGKIAGSKWGKALLIASAVVMGGIALYGAYMGATAASGAGFLGQFAAGAQGFVEALANPVTVGKQMLGSLGQAGATVGQATKAAQAAGQVGQATNMVTSAAGAAQGAAQGTSATGGLLSKAATGAWDFAKSEGGAQIIGKVIEGYGTGAAEEEKLKQEEKLARYYDNAWRDPNQLAGLRATSANFRPVAPGGYLARAARTQGTLGGPIYPEHTTQPASADYLTGLARG